MDALVLAVRHQHYLGMGLQALLATLHAAGIVVDAKSVLDPSAMPGHLTYWSL